MVDLEGVSLFDLLSGGGSVGILSNDGLEDGLSHLTFVLADELGRSLARVANLAEDVLRVYPSAFTRAAQVHVAAHSALVADASDGAGLACAADHSCVLNLLLSSIGSPERRIQDF